MYLADRFGRGDKGRAEPQLAAGVRDRLRAGARADAGHLAVGITMTAGRALAVAFRRGALSLFLLAIPGIGAAGAYEGLKAS